MEDLPPIAEQYGDYLPYLGQDGQPVVLGKGGFGVTICAYRLRRVQGKEFRDDFAIKILHKNAVQKNSKFFEEIQVLRGFDHPNLVRYIECNDQDGSVFLVMELCSGGDLRALVSRFERLSERAALQIILQLCTGLEVVHRRGYFHCDIKPENVLLKQALPPDADAGWLEQAHESECCFKLLDFGLAGKIDGPVRRQGFAGTAMYASPEQVRERQPDARSDLYSLGMTLWYLVAGKGPLLDANGNEIRDRKQAMKRHTSEETHDASFPRGLSEGFRALLSRMVKKKPDERFGSVGELAEAIRGVLRELTVIEPAASASGSAAAAMQLPAIGIDEAWGEGAFSDYFDSLTNYGRRGFAKLYQARQKSTGDLVALTAWIPRSGIDNPAEQEVAKRLRQLWEASNHPTLPPVVTRVVDVRRTAGEWCVAEEWAEGASMDKLLSVRDRIGLDEAARLLWPIAESCDRLMALGIHHARLNVGDIRIQLIGQEGEAWLAKPLEAWGGEWGIRFSLLALPPEFAQEMQMASVSRTVSGAEELDFSTLNLRSSFCRLFYRMIEGAEVPEVASYGDTEAYTEATELGSKSNILLRNYVCGVPNSDEREHTITEFLKEVCNNEAIYRLPMGTEGYAGTTTASLRHHTTMRASVQSAEGPARTERPPSSPSSQEQARVEAAPTPVAAQRAAENLRVSQGPPAPAVVSARQSIGELEANDSSSVDLALGEEPQAQGAAGTVRSPFGRHALVEVAGRDWRAGLRLTCPATQKHFWLPKELPPLQSQRVARPGAVISPYTEQPVEISPQQWEEGNLVDDPANGRAFIMPDNLPPLVGRVEDGHPGYVESPFAHGKWVEVGFAKWKPNVVIECSVTHRRFALPTVIPEWLQEAVPVPGQLLQVTEPDGLMQPFAVKAREWIEGTIISVPGSARRLRLPVGLPLLTGAVASGRPAGSVLSPFTGQAVKVAPADWAAGQRVKDTATGGWFLLPDELPLMTGKVDESRPGFVESPFAPGQWFEVEDGEWKPGEAVTCRATQKRFLLPATLPERLQEAVLISGMTGQVRDPGSNKAFAVKPAEWVGGGIVKCPGTGKRLRLPAKIPPLTAEAVMDKPSYVRSPYQDGAPAFKVSAEEWKPGSVIVCSATQRPMRLPDALPALRKPVPKLLLILAGVGVVLLLVMGWYTYQLIFEETGTPTGQPATNPAIAVTPPVAPKTAKLWPLKVILEGREPAMQEAEFSVAPGPGAPPVKLPGTFVSAKDAVWEIDFAKALQEQKNLAENLEKVNLRVSVPGYVPVEREVSSATSEVANVTLKKPEWKPVPSVVRWTVSPFYTQYYSEMVFKGTERFSVPIAPGRAEIPPGTYTVELKGRTGGVLVENRELPQKVEVGSGQINVLPLPAVPQHFGGVATYRFSPTVLVYGYINETNIMSPRRPEIEYVTPYVFAFNPDFAGGIVYEESNLIGPTSLQLLDTYVAASIKEESTQKGTLKYLQSTAIKNHGAKLNRFGDLLKADGEFAVSKLLERRTEMAGIGKGIFDAINVEFQKEIATGRVGPTFISNDSKKKVYYNDSVLPWSKMMGNIKADGPWARAVTACSGGGSVQERDLKELFAEEVFVTHPFVVTAVDEKGNLSFGTLLKIWDLQNPGTYIEVRLPYGKLVEVENGELAMTISAERGTPPDCRATLKAMTVVPMNR